MRHRIEIGETRKARLARAFLVGAEWAGEDQEGYLEVHCQWLTLLGLVTVKG